MEMKFNRKQVKKILEGYYKLYEDLDGDIIIKTYKGTCGPYEDECAVVNIKLKSSIQILGEDISTEREITKEDVNKAFKVILKEEGYEVLSVDYDSRIEAKTEGFLMAERTVKTAVFNGINVNMKKISKEMTKKRGERK